MAKNPDDRYPDCQAVLADVQAYREDRPPAAVEDDPGTRPTTTFPAAEPSSEPQLPGELAELPDDRRPRRFRDLAATLFRRHAPEFIQNLQNTTQQVDGAVAHHERQRQRLATLLDEARGIAQQLAEQLEANVVALAEADKEIESASDDHQQQAALAKKAECEENVEALQKQHDEQQQQVEEIEHQLGLADVKLVQLRSQRDALNARLRSADARQQLEGVRPRTKRRRWVWPAAIAGAAILVASLLFLLPLEPKPGRTGGGSDAPPLAIAPFDADQAKRHQQAWANYRTTRLTKATTASEPPKENELSEKKGSHAGLTPPKQEAAQRTQPQLPVKHDLSKSHDASDLPSENGP